MTITVAIPEPEYAVVVSQPNAAVIVPEPSRIQVISGGVGGGTYTQIVQTATANGAMTIALTSALPGLEVYINGLLQTDFSYTDTLLTLPASLNIITGDVITVNYYRGI